jgi:hypothetical protein
MMKIMMVSIIIHKLNKAQEAILNQIFNVTYI